MNTFSFPQISVNYKDADAAKRTMVNSSRVSYDIFKEAYDECMQHHEECWVMFLNQANRLLGLSCISKCGISQTVVDVRIILQTAPCSFIFMEFCNRKDYLVNRSTRSWPSS